MQYATIKFESGRNIYCFKHDIEGLQENDYVVCDTVRGFSLGQVVNTTPSHYNTTLAAKWIVQRVDLEPHLQRLEAEKITRKRKSEVAAKRRELKSRLDAKLALFRKNHELELLKTADPEAAEIISALQELEFGDN